MCGIFGYINPSTRHDGLYDIKTILKSMYHRGPDDSGYFSACGIRFKLHGEPVDNPAEGPHPNVGLGHTRLSIIDLSRAGRQPMANENNTIWITYNGEIYNFKEIKHELRQKGHLFRSETDTEVVVHAYEEWGPECLDRFNGMFAFAIYDARDRSLFLARDRLGIKPLYWSARGDLLVFASEIKALMKIPEIQVEVDWEGLLGYLIFCWSPEPRTSFKGVEKLPPGHWLLWRDGQIKIHCYWDVPFDREQKDLGEEAYGERLDELIQNAVERRMLGDVPVGVFLSGGLDSSLIATLMTQPERERVAAYTVTFDEQDKAYEAMPDDQIYARKVADLIKADHREILIRPDISKLLPEIIWHLEEPIADPAAINTYLISKAAKEAGTTVLLSGMGADEIFAGYRKHISVYLAGIYKRFLPEFFRDGLLRPTIDRLPVAGRNDGYRFFRWAKRFTKSASLADVECFIGNYAYCNAVEINELLHPDLQVDWDGIYPIQRHYDYFSNVRDRDLISQMTYVDTKLFLPGLNLAYTDKASMAASVEERVPFVDHEIVSFALNLPSKYRIHRLTQKYLLKKIATKYLPREIVYRPKAPFGAPLRSWMHRDLGPLVDELLSEESIRRRGYFRYKAVRKMIEDNRNGRQDFGHRIWALLTIELWHRNFVDQEKDTSQTIKTNLVKDISKFS